jgi:hypothetical protein
VEEEVNMLKRFSIILLILILTACEGEIPVIGVETLNATGGTKSVVRLHYFDSKDAAKDFYHKKGIIEYVLMLHPDKEEKVLFDQVDAKEEDGMKEVSFLSENGNRADDLAFEFLYEELGLGIDCAFNGKECK